MNGRVVALGWSGSESGADGGVPSKRRGNYLPLPLPTQVKQPAHSHLGKMINEEGEFVDIYVPRKW